MNIFEALRTSHDTQRELADNLIRTSGDSSERELLFKELTTELAAHAAAEERFFYVPLIAHDMTQEPSRHGIAEHHEMDELVEKLQATDFSSPAWLAIAKEGAPNKFALPNGTEEGEIRVPCSPVKNGVGHEAGAGSGRGLRAGSFLHGRFASPRVKASNQTYEENTDSGRYRFCGRPCLRETHAAAVADDRTDPA